jgi:exosortase/archaeosortase family protein
MLTGIILLQALNLVRIITLYWIGVHLPSFFNSAHMEIWPTAFIIVAITLFVGWKQWSSHQPETHAA